jgi:type I restriction enzyme M protein
MSQSTSFEQPSLLQSRQSIDSAVWAVCDILRRSNCASAIQYVPELTWILFLRILDERERQEAEQAAAVGDSYTESLEAPYRWRDWAAPPPRDNGNGKNGNAKRSGDGSRRAPRDDATSRGARGLRFEPGWKRKELTEAGTLGSFFAFVNGELLPYLKGLKNRPAATEKQKVISEILSGVERVRVDTEKNFLDVLDKVHHIPDDIDAQHYFLLSQVYEGLLLKMGEKAGDGGQFFTPREVIRAVVKMVDPSVGDTVYDPGCGTGGFLAEAYNHMRGKLGPDATPRHLETLRTRTYFGREKENLVYPIALANLVLHEIDRPNLWHGNTLTGHVIYDGLFKDAPAQFDVILTNPPFGGKEGDDAQTNFAYKTSATQVLFLQHVIDHLAEGGRCGMVIDEGVLFRTNERAFVQTKRKLLDSCDLSCVISLPAGVFTAAGAGVKTNLLFFIKGQPTERVWYYDLSDIKVGKTKPFLLKHLDDFFKRLPDRDSEVGESERSWWVDRKTIEERNFDLKAVNPNRKTVQDTRTPAQLLDLIEAKGKEVDIAITKLRELLKSPL